MDATTCAADRGSIMHAKQQIERLASSVGLSYKSYMESADAFVNEGRCLLLNGYFFVFPDELWEYYETVRGVVVTQDQKEGYFH